MPSVIGPVNAPGNVTLVNVTLATVMVIRPEIVPRRGGQGHGVVLAGDLVPAPGPGGALGPGLSPGLSPDHNLRRPMAREAGAHLPGKEVEAVARGKVEVVQGRQAVARRKVEVGQGKQAIPRANPKKKKRNAARVVVQALRRGV